jgi:hypothetical protein
VRAGVSKDAGRAELLGVIGTSRGMPHAEGHPRSRGYQAPASQVDPHVTRYFSHLRVGRRGAQTHSRRSARYAVFLTRKRIRSPLRCRIEDGVPCCPPGSRQHGLMVVTLALVRTAAAARPGPSPGSGRRTGPAGSARGVVRESAPSMGRPEPRPVTVRLSGQQELPGGAEIASKRRIPDDATASQWRCTEPWTRLSTEFGPGCAAIPERR